ncbi:HAMP domain-containing sensor histidine kinase [Helicobacter sp. 11S02596-1]|uniref:sensor histidine kinase n=1 Tax=Helicobacter sp. 11S02596-1 TaxID=1476194 RepID=UPI000BA7CDBE|nr:HAMP domain-containing sensor histidine kinase [Helicobacter sp. 11S02596-1]PAF42494.1 hypothetical protein BJI48_06765 [Helicobacter sp. 11S02596-1]
MNFDTPRIHSNQNLQIQTKMLIATITIGFLLVCITSFLTLSGLKHDYETNFPSQIQEIQKLKQIQDFYLIDVMNYINQKMDIFSNQNRMLHLWDEYKILRRPENNFLHQIKQFYQKNFSKESYAQMQEYRQQEFDEIRKVDRIIHTTNALLTKLYLKNSQHYQEDIKTLISLSVNINEIISDIIKLHLKISVLKNSTTNMIYKITLVVLLVFMFIVIFMTLFLSNLVLTYIKNTNQELQKAIDEKTKKLKEMNINLQKTIEYEVEQSRQKDQIMYQQARLASMGEMIQNIAHQWRQPLNSLLILIQSFKIKFNNGKLDKHFIDKQTEDALRIAKNMSATIENFRNFFRLDKSKNEFSLTKAIQDSIKIVHPSLRQKNISIGTYIEDDIKFYGHENAFTQVILNLIKNAYDAILEQKISNGVCEIDLNIEDDCAQIVVKDNAGGIKSENINKIFEPYFTTKHKSVGTGIGLYMTKQIIERQMYGVISASNANWISKISAESYYGAIFLIELPLKQNQQKG